MIKAFHGGGLKPCRRLAFTLKFKSIEEARWSKWQHRDAVNPDGSQPTGDIMHCGSCGLPIHKRDLVLRGRPKERDPGVLRHARNMKLHKTGGTEIWLPSTTQT